MEVRKELSNEPCPVSMQSIKNWSFEVQWKKDGEKGEQGGFIRSPHPKGHVSQIVALR